MSQREIQLYSYTLNIQSIKMKVKFPCKMRLQYAGEVLTPEVSQNESGKFIFNQEVTLKEDTDRTHFQIIAHISTDKGAKYIAGVIKLAQSELVHQEGEMMVIHLAKCLDSEACCELRVDQVLSEKVTKKIPLQKAIKNRQFTQQYSPKKLLEVPKNFTGSRSQFQFPLSNNRHINPMRTKQQGYQSIHEHSRSPAAMFRKPNVAVTYVEKNMPDFGYVDSHNRDKLIEAEVYKESYQKLKQKYKREAEIGKQQLNKRIALQNNQNNFKLEIMRLKLRCDEQQKTINDKNSKLKQMQVQLASLQKKQLDLNYLREEASNKQHTIRMLEDTIRTLNKDNEDLKNLNRQRFENEQQKIRELRNQVDSTRQRYEIKLSQLEKENRAKNETINQKDSEIRIREQRVVREQKLVDELEKQLQSKTFQFERSIQNQQSDFKLKSEQFKNVIERLEREKAKLQQELQSSRIEHEKVRSYMIKIEYDKKILSQQSEGFKSELSENKILKEKYQQLARDHRLLTQDKNHLQKQFEKTLQTKDASLSDLNKQFKQQIQHYKKIYREIEQKLRTNQTKSLELQSALEQKKNEAEKLKKTNQALNKQSSDLKQKEKMLRKSIKSKQDEIASLVAQLDSNKYKSKSGDQLSRYQIENLKQQINKAKKDLQAELIKSAQLTEKLSNQNNEVNRLKLQLQQSVENNEKDTTNFKDKLLNLQSYNKEYERKIEELNNSVSNLKTSDKQKQQKLQKSEIQCLKLNERIEKYQREVRMFEDKGIQYENQLRNKQSEVNSLQNAKDSLEKKLAQNEQKMNNLKNTLHTVTGDKNKNEKIIELLNREISDSKNENERQNKLIQGKEKLEEDLRSELKKSKEQYLKLQMKNTAFKKEYDRFKEHLLQTLSNTFSQIPLGAGDMKSSGVSIESFYKRGTDSPDSGAFNAEILNKISNQNKDIKIAMTKLIEHNKILQKDVQRAGQEGNNNAAKNQLIISNLNKKMEELQIQINRLENEKQETAIKNKGIIHDLEVELEDRQSTNKELLLQIEQFNFTINSLKMDQQASIEHFNLKHTQYKSKISELEEKIMYLTNGLNESEISYSNIQAKLSEKTSEWETEREINHKKQKQLQSLKQEKRSFINIIDENKRSKKELQQKISELQLKLATEIQLKSKGRLLLEDEERKGSELKEFVANLMKQKEIAIKSDLEKSQQIITLEANLLEANREKQTLSQENQRIKRNLDEHKESMKRLNNQIKDLQALGSDQKGRVSKLNEKIREKQRQLRENQQSINKLKQELQKTNLKSSKIVGDLKGELEQRQKQREVQVQNLTERINELERQRVENQGKITNCKSEILMLEQNLFMEKQAAEVKEEELQKVNDEVQKLKAEIKKYQQAVNSQSEQIKQKEQGMFQLSGKVYQLENAFQAKETQYSEKISLLIEDWSSKYDNMVDQYQQRLDLVEKQKNYFKTRLEEREEQYRKLVAQLRNSQLEDSGLRKALEQKVKRLQEQRLSLISSKNAQIQRLAEDNKSKFDQLKNKEADLRRLQHELEVARSTISKLEQSKRQTEQKIKQINKAYQSELEQLKKRQMINRSSTENLERIQWDVEREVKKTIQVFSKRIVSSQLKQDSQKILSTIKGLEDQVINAVSNKLSPSSN